MRPRYCTAFWSYTATAVDDPAAEHPVANIQTYTRWRRTWQSVDDTPVRLELQLPSITPVDIAGIYLNNANFDSVVLSTSTDGVSWTDVDTYALAYDEELDRRKLLIDDAVSTVYLGLTPGDLVDGRDAYELGAVALCQSLVEMGQGPERPGRGIAEAVTRLDYRGGGFETNRDGPPRVALSMGGRWIEDRVHTDLRAIINAGKMTPILIDEADHASHVSIVQRTQDVAWERSFKLREGLTFSFEECL